MQRHVLVLLVTFDLWVSLLVSVLACLFFGFGCGFASADLSGPGCRAGLRLLQWSLGVCTASPASSALALTLSPRAEGSVAGFCHTPG